jgi:hypothetical protein
MRNLNLQKIEIKKTVTNVTFQSFHQSHEDSRNVFKNLIAISLLSGASVNSFRQSLKERSSINFDIDKLKKLQQEMDDLIYEIRKEIDRVEDIDGINYQTTTYK